MGSHGLVARFGRDTAHAEWFYGVRSATRADLGSRLVRAWALAPAAVNERDLVPDLSDGADRLVGLLADKGLNGKEFAASRHGAHNFWGLLTRTASTLVTHTLSLIVFANE